jgi:hypothetical protein
MRRSEESSTMKATMRISAPPKLHSSGSIS